MAASRSHDRRSAAASLQRQVTVTLQTADTAKHLQPRPPVVSVSTHPQPAPATCESGSPQLRSILFQRDRALPASPLKDSNYAQPAVDSIASLPVLSPRVRAAQKI